MKYEIALERHYPHPIDAVWEGLTTNEAISEWLMETRDFNAEPGHRFEMTCIDDEGRTDTYRCQVLAIEPPRRMVWSWVLAGQEARGHTEVEFRLQETEAGTTVVLEHRGDRDRAMIEHFRSGWPGKLKTLAQVLDRRAADN